MLPATLVNKVSNLWLGLKLRAKLSVCLVGMTVIPLLLTTAITGYNSEKALTRLILDHNWNVALHTADEVDRMFYDKIKVLQITAATAEIKSMIPEKQLPLLKAIEGQDEDILIVLAVDINGNLITRSDGRMGETQINYSDRDYFQTAKQTGESTISETLISRSTGYSGIAIVQPIKDEQRELIGFLVATIELGTLVEHINQTKIGQTGYIYLVNNRGRILLHPNKERVVYGEDVSHWSPVKAVLEQQTGWTKYEVNDEKKLATYSYIPHTGWGLVAEQPLDEAMEYVIHVERTGFIMSFLAMLLAALIGIMIAGRMSKRITNISVVTGRLAAGDLNAAIQVVDRDEIGQLGIAFNSMAAQLKTSSEELRDSEERYRSLVENINIGVYRKNGNDYSFMEYANPALVRILGYSSVDELLQTFAETHFYDQEGFLQLIEAVDRQGAVKDREVVLCKKDGTPIWCSLTAIRHFDEKRELFWIDSVVEDITERKLAEEALRQAHAELEMKVNERTQELRLLNEKLYRISLQDGLTGIANRRYFDEVLEREWQQAKRQKQPLALVMIDVDWFKHYNDTYGHVAGDQCLRQIAEVLEGVAKRATDLAARYGGEEFALILPNTDQQGAVELGKQVLLGVRNLRIRNATAVSNQLVTVSLGIAACIPPDHGMPDKLIVAADQALYQAKKAGRNQLALSHLGMDDTVL